MTRHPLTAAQANAVYDVLVRHAGALEDDGPHPLMTPRGKFVFAQTEPNPPEEYRFQGSLGFGAKFWNYNSHWYVTAYTEDIRARPELSQIIADTNTALDALNKQEAV